MVSDDMQLAVDKLSKCPCHDLIKEHCIVVTIYNSISLANQR